jgi:hypothetical protein
VGGGLSHDIRNGAKRHPFLLFHSRDAPLINT